MSSPGGHWAGTLWAGKWCECCGERLADFGLRGPIKVPVTSGGDWRNYNRSGWWSPQYLPSGNYSAKAGMQLQCSEGICLFMYVCFLLYYVYIIFHYAIIYIYWLLQYLPSGHNSIGQIDNGSAISLCSRRFVKQF